MLCRLATDCRTIGDKVGYELGSALRLSVVCVGVVGVMWQLSVSLTLLTLAVVPPVSIATKLYGDYCEKLAEETSDRLTAANEVADEVISSMRTVRSFAAERREADRYRRKLIHILGFNAKRALSTFGYYFAVELSELVTLLCVLWCGGRLVLDNRISAGHLVSFMLYQRQLSSTIQELGNVISGWMESVGSSRKVFIFMDRSPNNGVKEVEEPEVAEIEGSIQFNNLSFVYPTRPGFTVLVDVSFHVESGETVALVGPSGGGKSTCISLLQRFYEPTMGSISVDNTPIYKYSHDSLHSMMSLVSQEPVLFARSIKENIAYGSPNCTDDQIKSAARLANADGFIRKLPLGYDTQVGEKGLNMSGGQKQRIAIARALVGNPKILLFDEATSALDATSEQAVQDAIYKNLRGHTVILIAHRLSTVIRADRIVVIDKGKVVQCGTHKELMENLNGLYRALVKDQLIIESC